MLTPQRARQIIKAQSEFPYWGNYQRFMTADEIEHVHQLFRDDPSGNVSVASVVYGIARKS